MHLRLPLNQTKLLGELGLILQMCGKGICCWGLGKPGWPVSRKLLCRGAAVNLWYTWQNNKLDTYSVLPGTVIERYLVVVFFLLLKRKFWVTSLLYLESCFCWESWTCAMLCHAWKPGLWWGKTFWTGRSGCQQKAMTLISLRAGQQKAHEAGAEE